MYLLDTNIWLERLLEQEKSDEVKLFLDAIPDKEIYISDLSFYSIAIHLDFKKQHVLLLKFIDDLFIKGRVNLISLEPQLIPEVVKMIKNFKLDFDDAYQFTCAETFGLELISYDKDFDKATVKRKTPAQIIKS